MNFSKSFHPSSVTDIVANGCLGKACPNLGLFVQMCADTIEEYQ